MMKVTKTIFVLGILLLSLTPVLKHNGTSLSSNAWSAESSVKLVPAGFKQGEVILKIDGMTCASCPAMVKTALKKLDGVINADVSYKEAKATVKYQEGKVTVEQIVKAIEGIGMKASPLSKDTK